MSEKLLEQLADFFDLSGKKRRKRMSDLKALLKKLRAVEKKLQAKYDKMDEGRKRKMIKKEICIVNAQRKKGLKALKKIKSEK